MRFRIVTLAILLAVASRGHGRPRDPDPLDNLQEAQLPGAAALPSGRSGSSPDSRYMTTTSRQRRTAASSSPTSSSRRRDISITSVKLGSSAGWQPRAVFPGLSFDTARKNYLPLGALSPAVESKPRANRRSIGRSVTTYRNPMAIPFIPSPQISTSIPIPVTQRSYDNKVGRMIVSNQLATPKPIPVSMSRNFDSEARAERKIASRTLVKILPQKLKPGYNVRYRNSTLHKRRPQISGVQLKNWPNEALQNVQDLLNYEKYTSFMDEDVEDKNKVTLIEKSNIPPMNSREPSNKSPEIQSPVRWSKIPIVEAEPSSNPNDRIDVDSTMEIDSLLDDLGNDRLVPIPQTSSKVSQNTVVHILNAGSKKPNVTVVEQPMSVVASKVNKTKTASTRPPQNVHIMFMVDKDESQAGNQTAAQQLPPTEILGTDSDCPTIMINSITQINNTIESKEGCTDLNIVINSHVLNTNIFKPTGQTIPAGIGVKDPYGSSPGTPPSNYPSYSPPNNYYQNNNNYYGGGKDPAGQVQSDDAGNAGLNEPQISTFEVFQGTHINLAGSTQSAQDVPNDEDPSGSDDSIGNDADGSTMSDPQEGTNDITGTGPETSNPSDSVMSDGGASAAGEQVTPQAAAAEASTEVLQASNPISSDIGTGQANGASPANLPSLPSSPNLPGASQLTNPPGSTGGASDDDDEDELIEALSPVNLLDSISSVFNYFNPVNPINYGIFGMAVAPFVAFAAGVVGVAAFLFPWAFPGSLNFARGWDDSSKVRIRFNPSLRDVVHSSIHKYRHLNEWKGRRRKRKRKR